MGPSPRPLNVLMVEDSQDDADLLLRELRKAGYDVAFERVETAEAMEAALDRQQWDVVLSDYVMPCFSGLNALNIMKERGIDIPFVIISGRIDEDVAVQAMKAGAHDYVVKGNLARLVPAIEREMGDAVVRRQRRKAEEDLSVLSEQLRSLTAHLQDVREEERTHIAREVHDELGQALTAMKMDVSWLANRLSAGQDEEKEKAREIIRMIETTIKTVQRISSELRPGILDSFGVGAAIEWLAQDFQKRMGISCKVSTGTESLTLDRDRSTAIFRIFQESLTNAARHARATEVDLSLDISEGAAVLIVRDNGRGINEEELSDPTSFGIMGIRERALSLGGEVKIAGIAGKGTIVEVKIPLTEEKKRPL